MTLEWDSSPPTERSTATVIVDLEPGSAFGDVALYDNGALVDSGHDYRYRWSSEVTGLSPGLHKLVATFVPDETTGVQPSQGEADVTIATLPTRAATSVAATPTPTDSQILVVGIPSTTASPSPSRSGGGGGGHTGSGGGTGGHRGGGQGGAAGGSGHGHLPFTGAPLDAVSCLAALLLLLGLAGRAVASWRRGRPASSAHGC